MSIERQWGSYSREEQLLAVALYRGKDGVQKDPPWHRLSDAERQPFLDRARARMGAYMNAGRA